MNIRIAEFTGKIFSWINQMLSNLYQMSSRSCYFFGSAWMSDRLTFTSNRSEGKLLCWGGHWPSRPQPRTRILLQYGIGISLFNLEIEHSTEEKQGNIRKMTHKRLPIVVFLIVTKTSQKMRPKIHFLAISGVRVGKGAYGWRKRFRL